MTTWLWIIGITAVVWPVIIAIFLDYVHTGHANDVARDSENKHLADSRANILREEIAQLRAMLEKQDSLIAALWQKTFGFYSEGKYDGLELPEYLGVKPDWHPHQSEMGGPVVYLVRYGPFPWGTHSESLYFPD